MIRTLEETLEARFFAVLPEVDFCSLRFVRERDECLLVRQNILQPVSTSRDIGVMITVIDRGGMGYAATSELTEVGLRNAVKCAQSWAQRSVSCGVLDYSTIRYPSAIPNQKWIRI